MFDSGFFAHAWIELARRLGYDVQVATADWGRGIDAEAIEQHLVEDPNHRYRAVAMVHNETSTGVTSPVTAVRAAIDAARHPALLLVDAISSLGSMDYHHDEWGVDVTITSSQKGLMLPPGLSFLALSEKAFAASKTACTPTGYWDWHTALDAHASGLFPYTPATSLLFGLRETTEMLLEEGLINVFARHARLGEATRAAASAWGLDIVCTHPERASNTVTAVRVPERYDADRLRSRILQRSNVALGAGLGRLASTTFRIGHLGDINDAMLLGALGAVETGLAECGIPQHLGGTQADLHYLIAAQTGIEHDNKKARRR